MNARIGATGPKISEDFQFSVSSPVGGTFKISLLLQKQRLLYMKTRLFQYMFATNFSLSLGLDIFTPFTKGVWHGGTKKGYHP